MARLGAEGTGGSGGPAVLVAVAKLLAPPAPHGLGEDGVDVKGQVGGADVGGWLGGGECKDKDLGGPRGPEHRPDAHPGEALLDLPLG